MLQNFKTGEVTLQLLVSEQGVISDVEVLKSDHPAFEKEVLKIIAGASVKPARINGEAIPFLYCRTVKFGKGSDRTKSYNIVLDDTAKVSEELLSQSSKPFMLPRFKVVAPLVYPFELLKKNKFGKVHASVLISPNGQPAEIQILEASDQEFANASKAMLAVSSFTPAVKEGKAIWSRLKLEHNFSRESEDVVFDNHALRVLRKSKDNNADVFLLADLDHKPRAIYHPEPELPYGYKVKQNQKVYVEFYIDKKGSVHLPHLLKNSNQELGWLAMTTLSRWQFEPPRVKGEPVDVLVTLPVLFSASKAIENPSNKSL